MTPRCPVDSLQVHYCQPQDSLMATMVQRTEIPGRPGVPLPYQLRTDDGITSVILLCMCMLAYVLSRGRHFLWQQVKDFFSTRERSSLFAEETNTDVRYRVLLLLHTGLVFGLLVFEYLSGRMPTALHAHPIRWLGLYIVACLAYYLLKCALYSFANRTFLTNRSPAGGWIPISWSLSAKGCCFSRCCCSWSTLTWARRRRCFLSLLYLFWAKSCCFVSAQASFWKILPCFLFNCVLLRLRNSA